MSDRTTPARRRRAATLTALTLIAGVAMPATYATATTTRTDHHTDSGDRTMRKVVDGLVQGGKRPAALAGTREGDGRTGAFTAGYGDLAAKSPVPADGQVRIASNTKTFTAVAVLQLVGEGTIGLDEPIETYLPDLIRGEGIDGRNITVRQLLQHTSGLPEYTQHIVGDFASFRHRYVEPRELLDLALQDKASFPPGAKWEYSNTNYVVAGLLLQKVTGRPVAEVINERVVARAGLKHTYFPQVGEMTIREKHPKGYHADEPGAPLLDVSTQEPSWGWAAGAMVSTNSDMNRFFTALLGGKLLGAAQLAEMKTTVPAEDPTPGARYGLGLMRKPLSCGGFYWGHGGDIFGYETRGGVTEKGARSVNIAVTVLPTDLAEVEEMEQAVDTALCR
ncbi:serine hydrolase domain-containing protein [Streptomyces corynorhini]|uniref:Class A beta-lactamase-related serine hydrolase n=1 Tax=Streptomyces corynorhini TaxID=2282652 RepID=A0A370B6Q2_9ACTN|nr:serine hydrolase domain-containing protein [Streptomyces corynorhini]RDG37470.1 class A beta-lactamase-related serine hydrolase [Streptomyces corynorhini]